MGHDGQVARPRLGLHMSVPLHVRVFLDTYLVLSLRDHVHLPIAFFARSSSHRFRLSRQLSPAAC